MYGKTVSRLAYLLLRACKCYTAYISVKVKPTEGTVVLPMVEYRNLGSSDSCIMKFGPFGEVVKYIVQLGDQLPHVTYLPLRYSSIARMGSGVLA